MDLLKSAAKTFVSLNDRHSVIEIQHIIKTGVRKKDNTIFWGQLERLKTSSGKILATLFMTAIYIYSIQIATFYNGNATMRSDRDFILLLIDR